MAGVGQSSTAWPELPADRGSAAATCLKPAGHQRVGTAGVQPFVPITNNQPRHAADLGCLGPRRAVVDRCHCQEAGLCCIGGQVTVVRSSRRTALRDADILWSSEFQHPVNCAYGIATSVARRRSIRDRRPSPMTHLKRVMSASTRARQL